MKEQYPSKARYDFSALEQSACRVNLLLLCGEIPDLSLSWLTFYDIHLLIFRRTAHYFFYCYFWVKICPVWILATTGFSNPLESWH